MVIIAYPVNFFAKKCDRNRYTQNNFIISLYFRILNSCRLIVLSFFSLGSSFDFQRPFRHLVTSLFCRRIRLTVSSSFNAEVGLLIFRIIVNNVIPCTTVLTLAHVIKRLFSYITVLSVVTPLALNYSFLVSRSDATRLLVVV